MDISVSEVVYVVGFLIALSSYYHRMVVAPIKKQLESHSEDINAAKVQLAEFAVNVKYLADAINKLTDKLNYLDND